MAFFIHNIGYIILALLGLCVVCSDYEFVPPTDDEDFEETAWATSKENPCSPFYDS